MSPPQKYEKRLEYAKALKIKEGTDDWLEFCDLATTSAGKIFTDIASNEEIMMHALPILFRSVRRKDLDEEDLKKLVKSIKGNLSIDWTQHENVKAKVRASVKRILRKHGFSPIKYPSTIELILKQAEALYKEWPLLVAEQT